MIDWKFDRERSLVEVIFSGIVTFDDIENYLDSLAAIEGLPDRLYILREMDNFDSKTLHKAKGASGVFNKLKERLVKYKFVKEAVLQNNPLGAAISLLYVKFFSNTKNYQIKIFSTRSAAMKWLGV